MPLSDVNCNICEHKDVEKINNSNSVTEDRISFIVDTAPDGGWGWMVVFASFMVHVLADGVTYSFGALATEFVTHFDASRESVGWMASILVGMTFITGPLVSILCNKFGYRSVTMAGAIVSTIGFGAPFFYPKFWFLYVSASVITGTGFGLVYLPSIVMVSVYFQKKRAFAIGLAVCGSGIGTFVFSPLIEYFNEMYGWQGSMLLVSALILNCMACGAVYRPLSLNVSRISRMSSTKNSTTNVICSDKASPLTPNYTEIDSFTTITKYCTSEHNLQKCPRLHSELRYFNSVPNIKVQHSHHHNPRRHFLKVSHPHLVLSSQTSIHLSHQLRSDQSDQSSYKSDTPRFNDECKSCIDDVFDVNLLWNPIFLLFAFSNFFTGIGFNAPFLYAKDRALAMNMSNNYSSFLISSIGIGNTVGRVIFGYLSTKKSVDRLQLYNGSLVLSGLVVIFSSFAKTYPWMIVYTLAFGLLTGTYVTLTSVVLVDLLGIGKLNASFGMTLVFQGVAVFIGPPLAGWIFDKTNSFDCSFWVCGGFLAISGFMLYLVYCFKNYRNRSHEDKV